jgi:hypothetical protein
LISLHQQGLRAPLTHADDRKFLQSCEGFALVGGRNKL